MPKNQNKLEKKTISFVARRYQIFHIGHLKQGFRDAGSDYAVSTN